MTIDSSIIEVSGVGSEKAKCLAKLNIVSIRQLLENIPRKYQDYSNVSDIASLKPGQITIKVKISQSNLRYVNGRLNITQALASDNTGSVRLIWFNQPYRSKQLSTNQEYYVSGDYRLQRQQWSIINPTTEPVSAFPVNTARILPVYRETKGLNSNQIRKIIAECASTLGDLPETLPTWLVKDYGLMSYRRGLRLLHFPESGSDIVDAKTSIAFREVFELCLASQLNKAEQGKQTAPQIFINEQKTRKIVKSLGYKLTNDQRKAAWQIITSMSTGVPMNRLLQGDVGSGKTVVAALAAANSYFNNMKTLIMVPTGILAKQHYKTFKNILGKLIDEPDIVLLTSNTKAKEKKLLQNRCKEQNPLIIIGTQTLIQDYLNPSNLGLVIIDEQHRFGVEQRQKLIQKGNSVPHFLSLSATPIPRSLALTLFGELKFSQIKELPPGRQKVETEIVDSQDRKKFYDDLKIKVQNGSKAYIVCPLIIESTTGDTKRHNIGSLAKELEDRLLTGITIGTLHGKMNSEDKDLVLSSFKRGDIRVLLSTTVIEVGVDDPDATIMIIENPESFGLAQLHQLRGRVGRSDKKSYCYLLKQEGLSLNNRLIALTNIYNGYELAEFDLSIRGPGAVYGRMQHGVLDFKAASLNDVGTIKLANKAAKDFLLKGEKMIQYPYLAKKIELLNQIKNLN